MASYKQRPDLLSIIIGILLIYIGYLLLRQYGRDTVTTEDIQVSERAAVPAVPQKEIGCIDSGESIGHKDLKLWRQNAFSCGLSNLDLDSFSDLQTRFSLNSVLDNIETICSRKVRVGNLGRGGWEVCDDSDVRPRPPCTAYLFHTEGDLTFATGLVDMYDCNVSLFDPAFSDKSVNRSRNIDIYSTFQKQDKSSKKEEKPDWNTIVMDNLNSKRGSGDGIIDLLKLNIGGAEWSVLDKLIDSGKLAHVRHLLVKFYMEGSLESIFRLKVLQKLERIGYKRFYTHKAEGPAMKVQDFPSPRPAAYDIHYILRME